MGWTYLMFMGGSGGILLIWDKRMVESIEKCVEIFSVACSLMGGNGPM